MRICSLILYEGDTVEELSKEFEKAIDAYLEECQKDGIEPEQPLYEKDDETSDSENP